MEDAPSHSPMRGDFTVHQPPMVVATLHTPSAMGSPKGEAVIAFSGLNDEAFLEFRDEHETDPHLPASPCNSAILGFDEDEEGPPPLLAPLPPTTTAATNKVQVDCFPGAQGGYRHHQQRPHAVSPHGETLHETALKLR